MPGPRTLKPDGAVRPRPRLTPRTDESVDVVVRDVIKRRLGLEADALTDNASFRDDLDADSLDVFDLLLAFEEAFNIEIPDAVADSMPRVADAIAYLESQTSPSPSRHTGMLRPEPPARNERS